MESPRSCCSNRTSASAAKGDGAISIIALVAGQTNSTIMPSRHGCFYHCPPYKFSEEYVPRCQKQSGDPVNHVRNLRRDGIGMTGLTMVMLVMIMMKVGT